MNLKLFRTLVVFLPSLILSAAIQAEIKFTQAIQPYLMWQIPGKDVSLPVYIYENGSQVGFIPSISLQYFAGAYWPTLTSASYDLYYKDGSQWHGCSLVLKKGSVDSSSTCPGVVISPPVSQNGATSNVYTVGFGALAWPKAGKAPTNPTATDYSSRTITFKNNTDYQMIQIGESCSLSNGANSAPSCQNTPIVATLEKNGSPYVVTVGKGGLDSSAFYLSSYCTAESVKKCGTPPTVADCSSNPTPNPPANWVCTGGYFPGQTPYATKIEPTILQVTDNIPDGASNIDVSAVDGYSLGVRLYPESPEYCTFTVPPENSNVLGAGKYSSANALAQLVPTSSDSLETLCENSSQLPAGNTGAAWDLKRTDFNGDFEGCMSPCSYATANVGGSVVDQFCCIGSYNTPGTCDVVAGEVGANTSTYNTNIQSSSQFKNVYGYAFGDAGSDYGCPPETNFIVEFISNQ